MQLKPWLWVVLSVLAYLFFLVLYLPAVYVTDFVQTQTKNEIQFAEVTGTLFEGQALAVEASGLVINNVSWSLNPWALFLLKANMDVKGGAIRNSEQIYINTDASISLLSTEHFSLRNTQVLVPAKTVLSQMPLPVAVTANGRFRVDIEQLNMSPECTELSGTGAWLRASVDTPQQTVDLGSFEANLRCENSNLIVSVLPDNTLQLSADILIDSEGKYEVKGQFRPAETLPVVIQDAADSFFARNQQGFYIINL